LPASSELSLVADTCVGALTGFLLAAVISGPTITVTVFFLLLGMLIACAARSRVEVNALAAGDGEQFERTAGIPGGAGAALPAARLAGHT
jgi:F0F1-type ATP synthase assembly protein I